MAETLPDLMAELAAQTTREATGADEQRALAQAYDRVFNSPEGHLVLTDILRFGGVMERGFVPGDPGHTAWNDGVRCLALHILRKLEWSPSDLAAWGRERASAALAQLMGGDVELAGGSE